MCSRGPRIAPWGVCTSFRRGGCFWGLLIKEAHYGNCGEDGLEGRSFLRRSRFESITEVQVGIRAALDRRQGEWRGGEKGGRGFRIDSSGWFRCGIWEKEETKDLRAQGVILILSEMEMSGFSGEMFLLVQHVFVLLVEHPEMNGP